MSNGRRLRRAMSRRPGALPPPRPKSPTNQILDQVIEAAPDCPGYGGGKWAVYAVGCCWWTSNPSTAAHAPAVPWSDRFGPKPEGMPDELPGLPCCPTCGSVLMQAPLIDFIDSAREKPEHFGKGGLVSFVAAHNSPCHPHWDGYLLEVQ